MPAPLVSSNVCKLKWHNLYPCYDLNNNDALPAGTMFTLELHLHQKWWEFSIFMSKLNVVFFCFFLFWATAIIYFSYLRSATVLFTSGTKLCKHSSICRMVNFGMSCYINVNWDSSVYNIKDMTIWRRIPDEQEAGVWETRARKMEKPVWTMAYKPREEWGGKKRKHLFNAPLRAP